jgi:hypothetical protein
VLRKLRLWHRRRCYRPGRVLTRFLAPDIRRDVEVVDVSLIDAGVVTAKIRTWNVLYSARGISPKPAFGAARMTTIKGLWVWSGAAWGGPVPDSAAGADGQPAS